MATGVALLTVTLLIGQAEKKVEGKAPSISPTAVLDYFAGDWKGVGTVGQENSLRARAEWDLHHTIIVVRLEWRSDNDLGADLIIHSWDAAAGRLLSKVYTTKGVQGEWTQTVEPDGQFFKITGTFQGSDKEKRVSAKIEVKIKDQDHYTWKLSDLIIGGEKKPGQEVNWTRLTGRPGLQKSPRRGSEERKAPSAGYSPFATRNGQGGSPRKPGPRKDAPLSAAGMLSQPQ